MADVMDRRRSPTFGRPSREKSDSKTYFSGIPPGQPRCWRDPDWELAAPGISCRLLATDAESKRVSMMVRLDPGTDYPPHRHAGREELYLLHGELMIDEKKVCPGRSEERRVGKEGSSR